METVGLKEEDVLDRTKWKRDIQYHSGDPRYNPVQMLGNPENNTVIIIIM